MKKELTLQEHQEIIYEILYALDDFCRGNHIKYFLAHGTLLGAVRHGGIIPWDDDADVMMERADYERFIKLIHSNPIEGFEAYTINYTKDYYYPFTKFGKKNTCVVETDWHCVPKGGIGINIDVFPIDGCPNDRKEAEEYVVNVMNSYFSSIRNWFNFKKDNFYSIRERIYWLLRSWRKCSILRTYHFNKLYKQSTTYQLEGSKYYFSFWTFYGAQNLQERKCIETLIEMPFGQRNLFIPKDFDKILRDEYGDYMTPPSEIGKISTHKHDCVYSIE